MLNPHDERTITALTRTVLDTLRKNLADHGDIVREAREGYVKEAEAALAQRLAQIREGKLVNLTFQLVPPQDHSKDYETVIKMLELHLEAGGEKIELRAADVQQYVLNNWGWMDQFLLSNSAYSHKARTLTSSR